LADLVMRVAGL